MAFSSVDYQSGQLDEYQYSNSSSSSTGSTDLDKKRPTKGRVFQCTGYQGCSMSFTRLEHLARHKRKHTGERPFTCPYCSKNFSRLDNLRQHKQTVHAYETYLKGGNQGFGYEEQAHSPATPFYQHPLISPPNSQSPNSQYYQGYYGYPQTAQNGNSQQATPALATHAASPHLAQTLTGHLGHHGHPGPMASPDSSLPLAADSVGGSPDLKLPTLTFKPKKRPLPLTLNHSHLDSPPIQTAPAGSTFLNSPPITTFNIPRSAVQSMFNYTPLTTPSSSLHPPSLTPNLVLPLSPLFHQLFSQTTIRSKPTHLSNVTNHIADIRFKEQNEKEKLPSVSSIFDTKRTWLSGVLNELEPARGKKPTINSLLSPYESRFPESSEAS